MDGFKVRKDQLFAFAIVWLGHFFVDAMIGFWSVYKTLAGLDLAIAGVIAGVSPLIGEGMQLFFGYLGDKGHRKGLLLFAFMAVSLAVFFPYTDSYFVYFLIFLTICIGSGAFHPTGVAITSRLTEKPRGVLITFFAMGGALGMAFSHMIFTKFYQSTEGKTAALAFPLYVLIAITALWKSSGTQVSQPAKTRRYGLSALKKLFRVPTLRLLYFAQVGNQALLWATIFLLPDVLLSKGYPSWICFGAGHFWFIMGGVAMMVPGGYLSDRYPPKYVLLTSSIMGTSFLYLFLFSPLLTHVVLLFLLFALGACLGLANPVAVSIGNRVMPSRPGLVSAFLMGLVWCISEGIGPGVGGMLAGLFADNGPIYALALIGVMALLGMGAISQLPRDVEEVEFCEES